MACVLVTSRLQDILDMVEALLADPDSGVTSYDDLVKHFAANFPEVSEKELGQALMPYNETKNKDIREQLEARKRRLTKLQNGANRLLELVEKGPPDKKTKVVPDELAKEIAQITRDIRKLAGVDIKIPPEAYGDIISRIENLTILHDGTFEYNGEALSEERLKSTIEEMRKIRRAAKVDEIDGKIKELDKQIENLKQDKVDLSGIDDINLELRVPGLNKKIAEKELKLGEKRVEFDVEMARARRRARAAKGFLGFKGKAAQKLVNAAIITKENIWEPWRALKFMMDISAWGVQAAPLVYSLLAQFDIKAASRGDFAQAFSSQRALSKIFYESVGKIFVDSMRNASRYGKTAKSTYAQVLLNEIRNDAAYPMAKRAGLQISEAGTLTSSEEVFTSNLINRVPIFGAIKDFSEDTMVSTLNALRMLKFKQFYDATDGTSSIAEYEAVAETINRMTGTTKVKGPVETGFVMVGGKFLSAPKLFLSRLKLLNPVNIARIVGKIDLPKSAVKGKFVFQTEGDRFIFNQMMKSVKGYVLLTALFAALPDTEFEEDPRKKSFLRYRSGNLAVDATGGMGTVARTIMKAGMFAYYKSQGKMPNGSDIKKPMFNESAITELLKGFIQYKLHPTITAANQTITGRDFFGESYDLFGKEGAAPHLEGMMRAFLPILAEGIIDNGMAISEGNLTYSEAGTDLALNIIGASSFRYPSRLTDPALDEYFREVGYKPAMRYPSKLSKKVDSRTKEYLQEKYQIIRDEALQELIESSGYDASTLPEDVLRKKWTKIKSSLEAEFEANYADDIAKLKDDPSKKKKRKKSDSFAPKK